MKELSELLKTMTRTEIASRVGVTERTIYRWETGKTKPQSIYDRRRIAQLFNEEKQKMGAVKQNE